MPASKPSRSSNPHNPKRPTPPQLTFLRYLAANGGKGHRYGVAGITMNTMLACEQAGWVDRIGNTCMDGPKDFLLTDLGREALRQNAE